MKKVAIALGLLTILVLPTVGCSNTYEEDFEYDLTCPPSGCTNTYKFGFKLTTKTGASPNAVSSALSSGYAVIIHVPSGEFSADSSSQPQATLTATTDTGYTSSIVVNLTPTGSASSTLYSGYTAYTFAVQSSSQLTAWVNSVNSHTSSTSTITATSTGSFLGAGDPGEYTVYAQLTSSQTGAISPASAVVNVAPGSDPACNPGSGPGGHLSCPGNGI